MTLGGQKAATTADAQGKWLVELPARKKGENLTLTITGQNTLVRKNIIVGDIWLCSGQSNMEWFLAQSYSGDRVDISVAMGRMPGERPPVRSGAYTIKERTGTVVAQGVAKFGKAAAPWRQSIEGEFAWKLKGVADGIYDVEVRLADEHGAPLGVLRDANACLFPHS